MRRFRRSNWRDYQGLWSAQSSLMASSISALKFVRQEGLSQGKNIFFLFARELIQSMRMAKGNFSSVGI